MESQKQDELPGKTRIDDEEISTTNKKLKYNEYDGNITFVQIVLLNALSLSTSFYAGAMIWLVPQETLSTFSVSLLMISSTIQILNLQRNQVGHSSFGCRNHCHFIFCC